MFIEALFKSVNSVHASSSFTRCSKTSKFNHSFIFLTKRYDKKLDKARSFYRWDEKTSAVIPDEDVFYTAGFLFSSGFDNWQTFEEHNRDILKFCAEAGIGAKLYLPHFESQKEWVDHFGRKWPVFQQRKALFDPKHLLSPGQKIF